MTFRFYYMFIAGPLYMGVSEDFMGALFHPKVTANGNTGGSGNSGGSGDKGGSGNGGGSGNKGRFGNCRGDGLSYEDILEFRRAQAMYNVGNATSFPTLGDAVLHLEDVQAEMAENQRRRLNSLQARLIAARGAGASPGQIDGIQAQIAAVNNSYRAVNVQNLELQGVENVARRRRN